MIRCRSVIGAISGNYYKLTCRLISRVVLLTRSSINGVILRIDIFTIEFVGCADILGLGGEGEVSRKKTAV